MFIEQNSSSSCMVVSLVVGKQQIGVFLPPADMCGSWPKPPNPIQTFVGQL